MSSFMADNQTGGDSQTASVMDGHGLCGSNGKYEPEGINDRLTATIAA